MLKGHGNSVIARHEQEERYNEALSYGCPKCGELRSYELLECSESEEECTKPCDFYIEGLSIWKRVYYFFFPFKSAPKKCEFLRLVERCDNCNKKLQVNV